MFATAAIATIHVFAQLMFVGYRRPLGIHLHFGVQADDQKAFAHPFHLSGQSLLIVGRVQFKRSHFGPFEKRIAIGVHTLRRTIHF
ncbi:hypothetical protein BpHYR1_049394 [Brachionus plicatilis]|uniref:Uncharacterized protein n=1 Tax=Brachionus plicatilis TaxID=10195 RepID=A0A3M7RDW0_BRAPC|nr:hypothetical protein BpHYR1_049394 [Brachionus plicatilis]